MRIKIITNTVTYIKLHRLHSTLHNLLSGINDTGII